LVKLIKKAVEFVDERATPLPDDSNGQLKKIGYTYVATCKVLLDD